MAGRITNDAIIRAANALGCEIAAVRAVIAVESRGSGFLSSGRPRILLEAHKFSEHTGGAYDRTHPRLSVPTWQQARELYIGGESEYGRLYAALQLDPDAAQQACSWGLFQVMGFNWAACGERSLAGFIHAMYNNEDAHLALFVKLIQTWRLGPALRARNWITFAEKYNGAGFAKNAYHTKLEAAYVAAKAAE